MRNRQCLYLALPKGRMQKGVFTLLREAGIEISGTQRGYRPRLSLPEFETKILKPQNIVEMLQSGSRDLGFAGADWVSELSRESDTAEVVELLDTGLDPVRLVAAAPATLIEDGQLPQQRLVVASEYEVLTRRWIRQRQLDAQLVRSYGATEVYPPEDADLIVDNTATGATLRDNGLLIVDELMTSSTRLYASRAAFNDPQKRDCLDNLVMLLSAVLEGRRRSMIEVNVSVDQLNEVIDALPAMQRPTVAPLHGNTGYAVRAAVPRRDVARVIPLIKSRGGRDIVVSNVNQIIP